MNCKNCGAAMVLVRDYFACEYCTAFHFPSESTDGVRVLEEGAAVDCPLCQLPLSFASLDQVRVKHCENCRGILVDRRRFASIVESRRSKYPGREGQQQMLDEVDRRRRVDCPKCKDRMDLHPYYGPGRVMIDTCGHCALIWLDHGELTTIARAPGH